MIQTINSAVKRYALSSLTTFITAFSSTLVLTIQNGHLEFTLAFIISLFSVAARAGIKAIVEGLASQHADDPTI